MASATRLEPPPATDLPDAPHPILLRAVVFVVGAAQPGDPDVADAVAGLLPLVTTSTPPPTAAQVDEIAASDATTLFVAREGEGGVASIL